MPPVSTECLHQTRCRGGAVSVQPHRCSAVRTDMTLDVVASLFACVHKLNSYKEEKQDELKRSYNAGK